MTKRGQAAVEFVFLASAMLLGVSILVISAQSMIIDVNRDSDAKVVSAILGAVTEEIRLAEAQPEGYERTVILPASIGGSTYGVSVIDDGGLTKDALVVHYRNNNLTVFIDQNVSGTLSPGSNLLRKEATVITLN